MGGWDHLRRSGSQLAERPERPLQRVTRRVRGREARRVQGRRQRAGGLLTMMLLGWSAARLARMERLKRNECNERAATMAVLKRA